MSKFWELLEESVIVQSLVTLIVVCVIAYMVIAQQSMPGEMWSLAMLVLGYWFGSKGQVTARKAAEKAVNRVLWQEEGKDGL